MYQLTHDEIIHFQEFGYIYPLTLCSPDEMVDIRQAVEQVLEHDPPFGQGREQSRHLDSRVIYDLCSHPAVVQRMAAIYGPDLVLWRSNFFIKYLDSKAIPWHQDRNYWPIEPPVNITAWIAIDKAGIENACMQFIPGSHRTVVPHIPASGVVFNEMADPDYIDTDKAVSIILKPGEFVLFNERLVHYSAPNTSTERRIGLAVRVTIPIVKVGHDELFKGHKVIQLCGEDRMGFNQTSLPPA